MRPFGAEVTEHAALDDALKVEPVEGKEVGGLVEAGFPIGPLIEEAVEDDQVEVGVGVEGGAEPVEGGDGAE